MGSPNNFDVRCTMRLRGWVYVITNEAMPGLIKIGYSMKDPWLRAAELANTGAPHPYQVVYDALTFDPRDIEQAVHERLAKNRAGREWFKCSVDEAIEVILEVSDSNDIVLIETHHRPDGSAVSTNQADRAAKRENFYRTFGPDFRPGTADESQSRIDPQVQPDGSEPQTEIKTKWRPVPDFARSGDSLTDYRCAHCGRHSRVPPAHTVRCEHCGKTGFA
jgi:hypothetical protein